MVVMTIEGVTRAIISGAEKTVSRGGVSTDMSMLATEEAGSVTVTEEAGLTVSVGEFELVNTIRPVVAEAGGTRGRRLAY